MKQMSQNESNSTARIISIAVMVIMLMTGFFPVIQLGASEATNEDAIVTVDIISSSNNEVITMIYEVLGLNKEVILLNGLDYYRYSFNKESNILKKGFPDLPAIHRSILIPDDQQMTVEILDVSYEIFEGIDIIPSKGEISRTVNPDDIPYMFDDIYTEDVWYPESNVELQDPYILRDFRGLVVVMNPIQYNPLQHRIRIVSEITIQVTVSGPGVINVIDRVKPVESISEEFNYIYNQHFMNFDVFLGNEKYTPVVDQGTMLIICYDDFYDEMIPFVTWKNMKGQFTEMVNFSEVGSTATDIDIYIENYYNTNGLTFVLLVGDSAQIPTLTASGGESDVTFSYISADYYSDLFIGRFSAETNEHVQTQVNRTINYEKYPLDGGSWYHRGLGVASNQGVGDEGEYDDEHIDIIRDKLLAYTYSEVEQSYDPWGTSTIITNAVNNGLSIINYCGHGSTTSWGNGGGFSNNNVNALINDNMLPFIVSVACVVGNFGGQTCFTEAWLRATNNGEPTGAIAHFGSSINQDWDEPMDGQDEFNDILVESYVDNIKRTFGGLAFNGVMHMLDEYPSAGIDDAQTWHIFGDPSVVVRTDTPIAMTIDHDSVISISADSFQVAVSGVENALCALSYNGYLIGTAYTDASGEALILIDQSIPDGISELDLVVTAYNKIPYITTINLLTTEPYLAYNPMSYYAGLLGENETVQTTFEIWNENVGVLEYTLSESCEWIEVSPLAGDSSGEHDMITVDIDTQSLSMGFHQCEIMISSNGGDEVFPVSLNIIDGNERIDVEQGVADRGFPIRHAGDGDWAGAQSYIPTVETITRVEIYLRKFGNPEFDLTLEFREGSIDGVLLDTLVFTAGEISSSWEWIMLDFNDVLTNSEEDYFIICPPAPSGVTTSFGYEWGYVMGNPYADGSFWFTRDGGWLWRDLPSMYDFSFRTYGI